MNNDSEDALKLPKKRRRFALRIAAWIAGAAVVVLLLAGMTITILLHNQRFHDYVLRSAERQASESLGVRVTLQNFALNLSHLSLDLYGLTVDGAAPYTDTPLLQVDHAEAGVQVVSILRLKWYLDSFQIDRPVVHIFVDAHGVSNLPTFKSGGASSGNTSLFDLAIRHALLDRGEVYYNNRQSALAADLRDVEFKAAFNSLLQEYSGRLAYSDGRIVSGSFKPLSHSLEAVFDVTPTTFHLTEAKLSAGPSQISLNATVQNYSSPNVDAHYDATVDGMQAGQILNSPSIPTGQVRATGSLHYQQSANRSPLESLMLNGDLSSRQLNVKSASVRTQITNLLAHYSLANGDVTLHDLKLNLLGGQLTGFGTMTNIVGDSHSKVNANLRGVSLADLKRLTGSSPATRNVGLEGALNAQLAATWGKTFNDLTAHADATINGRVMGAAAVTTAKNSNASQAGVSAISIDSAIHGTYTAGNQQIALKDSYVRMPQTSLTMNGVVSNRSSLAIRLQADDLREVEAVADLFRTASQGQPLQPLGLAGTASFQGTVQGSTSAPHLTGQFLASNVHVNGSEWKVLRTSVDASPSLVSLQHGDLEPATRGHIRFNVSTELTKWSFSNTSPVQVEVDASQLDVADLAKLAGQPLPVSGTLAANFNVHGTELSPAGNGSISLDPVVAYDQPIRSAKLSFAGTGDEAHADLEVQLPAGNVQGKVTVQPRQRTFAGEVTAAGIKLDQLQALKARNVDATGELSVHASGQGSFDNPQLDATLQIPQLVVQSQTITALKLQMDVADRVANATLTTSAVNTNIQAKAKVNLTGDYLADATLDTQAIPFAPLLAAYLPEQAANIDGQTEVHAILHGPLKNKNLIEAHVSIPMLQMAYGKTVQLAAASPIHVDYKNGVVAIQRATIHGTDTDLQVQGSIPIAGIAAENTPVSLMLLGTVNLQLAQLFDPDVKTSGELKFNVNSTGAAGGSDFGGQINIVDAAFASGDLPIGLQHGNGVLTFTKDRLNITKFEGTVGGGSLTAQGGVALQPSIQFDIGVAAHDIRMLYPQGVRESLNANLRLAGTTDSAVLGGSVNLSDISFTSAFDLNSFISQFSGGVETPPTPGFGQNLQLNLAVRSSNDVSLVSRALSVDGSANLQVRGTASSPVILGRVNLNSGDIILNGDRYLLDGGTIAFVNPSETEPVVNLSLKTTIQQYDVFLRFNGPIDQLRTNYSSNPALPSADIINLLAFGETTEANANATTTTNQAAQSLVASQVSSQVTSRISKIAGISQLSINPVLTSGSNQGTGANITIQQRVTSNLFVTFTSDVANESQTIQGQYQVSPRVAISATRDQNGGFAVDTLIKKTW